MTRTPWFCLVFHYSAHVAFTTSLGSLQRSPVSALFQTFPDIQLLLPSIHAQQNCAPAWLRPRLFGVLLDL